MSAERTVVSGLRFSERKELRRAVVVSVLMDQQWPPAAAALVHAYDHIFAPVAISVFDLLLSVPALLVPPSTQAVPPSTRAVPREMFFVSRANFDKQLARGIVHRDLRPENVLFGFAERHFCVHADCVTDAAAALPDSTGCEDGRPQMDERLSRRMKEARSVGDRLDPGSVVAVLEDVATNDEEGRAPDVACKVGVIVWRPNALCFAMVVLCSSEDGMEPRDVLNRMHKTMWADPRRTVVVKSFIRSKVRDVLWVLPYDFDPVQAAWRALREKHVLA